MQTLDRLWLIGLIAISAAIWTTPANAAEAPPATASWHGRPIQRPERDGTAVELTAARPRTAGVKLGIGDGYAQPGGSHAVRRVQRLLQRIGYRCGPLDGLFGPRTRASVEWFQIKHGLPPTGRVGPLTLALLRLRAAGVDLRHQPRPRTPAAVSAAAQPGPMVGPSARRAAPALPLGVAALLALLASGFLLWRRKRTETAADPPRRRPPLAGHEVRVIGYAAGRDRGECARRARAIERACVERGWAVTAIVREQRGEDTGRDGHHGLALALEQFSRAAGGRLVTYRLGDVGRSRRDLAALLGWCARSHVELVALDVGLDTGSAHGRLAARCLAAVGNSESNRSGRDRAHGVASGGATM